VKSAGDRLPAYTVRRPICRYLWDDRTILQINSGARSAADCGRRIGCHACDNW